MMPADDYDDLLIGLGSDDLNDFEDTDDFGDELERRSFAQSIAPAPHPPLAGFTTARGNKVPPPSAAALEKARRIAAEIEASLAADQDPPLEEFDEDGSLSPKRRKLDHDFETGMPNMAMGFQTAAGTSIPPPSKSSLAKAQAIFQDEPELELTVSASTSDAQYHDCDSFSKPEHSYPSHSPSITSTPSRRAMFTTGSGQVVDPPSRASLQAVASLFGEEVGDTQEAPLDTPRSGFTTGSGAAVPPPSLAAQATVMNIFQDVSGPSASRTVPSTSDPSSSRARAMALFGEFGEDNNTPSKPRPRLPSAGFLSGTGTPAPAPSASRAKALALFADADENLASRNADIASFAQTPIRNTPNPITSFTPLVTQSNIKPQEQLGLPQRTPLRTTTNTFSAAHGVQSSKTTPIVIKTPLSAPRRLGLGGTPRARGAKSFSTPFKQTGDTIHGTPTVAGKRSAPTRLGSQSRYTPRSAAPVVKKEVAEPVFDLKKPENRLSARKAFLKPQYHSATELEEMGIPDEIWRLDLTNALQYQFIAENAVPLGSQNAFNVLRREGCSLVTQKWVDNHYPLILWKLAGLIQAQPTLFDVRWNWGEVIEQLKYRYEREINSAQRPILRRIQEHDSSASVPMILCVSAVHFPPPVKANPKDAQEPRPKPYLEMTDGWYRINVEIDDCLARAVERRVIAVGRKVAISGAKLDSANEGEEVLEAQQSSRLIIAGNSTAPARWDALLGVQPNPFIAGLSSLSVDGGVIAMMDIVIDKIYPLAFIPQDRALGGDPWDEKEEAIRADKWQERYRSEMTRLSEELRARLGNLQELCFLLQDFAEGIEDPAGEFLVKVKSDQIGTPPQNLEDIFERILISSSPSSILSTMGGSTVIHLAHYARRRLEDEMTEGQAEAEAELRTTVPQREIRDFRLVKFHDAVNYAKDPARVGMLNVWEARNLGEGALFEGERYLVTNLFPGRSGDWSVPRGPGAREVYLHTRRESRWQRVQQAP